MSNRKNFLADKNIDREVQKYANDNFNGNWTKAGNVILRLGLESMKMPKEDIPGFQGTLDSLSKLGV